MSGWANVFFKIGEMSGGFVRGFPRHYALETHHGGMSAFLFPALFSCLAPVLCSTFVLSRCYYSTLDSRLYTIISCPIYIYISGFDLPLSSSICLVPVGSSFGVFYGCWIEGIHVG